jgi:hypothetical protein
MNCYKFWKFKGIFRIFKQINVFGKRKIQEQCWAQNSVQGLRSGSAWPSGQIGPRPPGGRARDVRDARGHRGQRVHSGAARNGSPVAPSR